MTTEALTSRTQNSATTPAVRWTGRRVAAVVGTALVPLLLAGCADGDAPAQLESQSHGQNCEEVDASTSFWHTTYGQLCSWVQYDTANHKIRGYAELRHMSKYKSSYNRDDDPMSLRLDSITVSQDGRELVSWQGDGVFMDKSTGAAVTPWVDAPTTGNVDVHVYGTFKDTHKHHEHSISSVSESVSLWELAGEQTLVLNHASIDPAGIGIDFGGLSR